MEIGRTLIATTRAAWRRWLKAHHATAKDIWLIYYKKGSGKKRIPYNHAVEEALCFGWIDSIIKSIDEDRFAQRFSPRRPRAQWSAANIERVRKLIAQKKMTKAGLAVAGSILHKIRHGSATKVTVPRDILMELRSDPLVWKRFSLFPAAYKRVRIGWIDAARPRPEIFRQRLQYFVRMTRQGKRYGFMQK